MGKRPASPESIARLIDNSKHSIRNCERLLHNVEKVKAHVEAIPGGDPSSLQFLRLTFEILSGGISGMYECTIALCRLMQTDSVYEKRYQMQTINLSQFEWCRYLTGSDGAGMFAQYCALFAECTDRDTVSYLQDIRDRIRALGARCDVALRNITAHYDAPSRIYREIIRLDNEDEYAQRIGEQMEISDKIMTVVDAVLDVMRSCLPSEKSASGRTSASGTDLRSLVNDWIADVMLQNRELQSVVDEQLSTAWDELEGIRLSYTRCEKFIKVIRRYGGDPQPVQNMLSLLEFGWAVFFMRSDLACAMNSYLNAEAAMDRSVCLHRIYMIETAALTHLYGYDEKYRQKSIWAKIKRIAEFASVAESHRIERMLADFTDNLDRDRRNMYTHYRENGLSNISRRWRDFQTMDHVEELLRLRKLILLCKEIHSYIRLLLSEIGRTQSVVSAESRRRSDDMTATIRDIGIETGSRELVEASGKIQDLIEKVRFLSR